MAIRSSDDSSIRTRFAKGGFDRLLTVQRPVVLSHLRSMRRQHPEATPADILHMLEQRYIVAVTTGGAAVGAAAVLPGVGTVASLAMSGVETAGFLEASALFSQSVAELHGVTMEDPERSSTLVMALMLGPSGGNLVRQLANEASGTGPSRAAYWGELVSDRLPNRLMRRLTDRVRRSFLRRFAARQGANIVGRAVPFGIGAVIGGAGNHAAGRKVIAAAQEAFGPAPATFPNEVDLGTAKSSRGEADRTGAA